MIKLKGCPKCGGDVHEFERPANYDDPFCIQCGWRQTHEAPVKRVVSTGAEARTV